MTLETAAAPRARSGRRRARPLTKSRGEPVLPPEDAALVARCLAGDAAAEALFVERYADLVYRVIRGLVRDEGTAEDLTQETFVRAFRNLGRFRGGSRLSTWLYRIAVNEARMHLRAERAAKRVPPAALVPIDPDGHMRKIPDWTLVPERRLLEAELRRALEGSVAALSPIYKTAFVLAEIEGLDHLECARILGVRKETVKTRVHRARLLLRRALSSHMEEERR